MNAKENLLAFYRREPHEWMPCLGEAEHGVFPVNGFWERPPFNQGGKDWFGAEWEFVEAVGAPAPDCKVHVLDDICDWREKVVFPNIDEWDWEKALEDDAIAAVNRNEELLNVVILNGLWERTHVLMGFEEALIAVIEDPKEMAAFYDALTDYKIALINKICDYYQPDVITYHDDWGMQTGPFLPPDLWRELIKPRTKRIVDAVHARGVVFEQHSCGKFDEIIPDIAEIGVDVLQCMDINDIDAALENTGTTMCYAVSVHQQEFFAKDSSGLLTEEEVRATLRLELEKWGNTGVYAPFPRKPSNWYEGVIMEEITAFAESQKQDNKD